MNNTTKELSIFIKNRDTLKKLSTWRFFPNLGFCFKFYDNRWKEIEYNKGLNICKRVMNASKSDNSIHVKGSMIDELDKDNMISELFKGEKIILR